MKCYQQIFCVMQEDVQEVFSDKPHGFLGPYQQVPITWNYHIDYEFAWLFIGNPNRVQS